jgi:uncharacterized damage-inducible protein DinB
MARTYTVHHGPTMPHPLILQLRFTRSEFARAFKGVTEEEAVQRPHGLNAIGWAVAHLTWQEQKYFLHYGQAELPYPDVDRVCRPGAPASTPTLEEAQRVWREVTRRADPWLDDLDVAAMAAPYRKQDGSHGARIVGDLVQRTIYHYWFHLGQVVAVRRLLGHEKVPQFVGSIDQQASYVAEAGDVG